MPSHLSLPTPSGGSGPRFPATLDSSGTTDTPLNVKDEPRANAEALADRVAKEVFGTEDDARNTAGLIASFVSSWEQRKHGKSPAAWLADEFRRYPDLWIGEEEIVSTAAEASLLAHLDAGRSKASWLVRKIEQGAAAAGASNVDDYAANLGQPLETANSGMYDAITIRSGAVNRVPHLDTSSL